MSGRSDGLAGVAFVCPRCRAALAHRTNSYECTRCGGSYPVVLGIPDFRITADPWIAIADDREKGLRLERETAGLDFEAMVRAYWAMTPDTPRERAARFIEHVLAAESRSQEWLAAFGPARDPEHAGPWLDVGCGTADIAAAAGRGAVVVGLDVAFRWLVVARRRLAGRGLPVLLVCGNAEALPFTSGTFSRAFCVGTLEHCEHLDRVLLEARRVLAPGGQFYARTVNRYSVLSEPHVGVWGVGWMPRRWADRYVRWRSGQRYLHHWPRGAGGIRRALARSGFAHARVDAGRVLAADRARLSPSFRPIASVYEGVRRVPVLRALCRWIAPVLDASGLAPRQQ